METSPQTSLPSPPTSPARSTSDRGLGRRLSMSSTQPMSSPPTGRTRRLSMSAAGVNARRTPLAVVPQAARAKGASRSAPGRKRRSIAEGYIMQSSRGDGTPAVMPPAGVHRHHDVRGNSMAARGGNVRAPLAMRRADAFAVPESEKYLATLIAEVKALPRKSRESFLRRFAAGVDLRGAPSGKELLPQATGLAPAAAPRSHPSASGEDDNASNSSRTSSMTELLPRLASSSGRLSRTETREMLLQGALLSGDAGVQEKSAEEGGDEYEDVRYVDLSALDRKDSFLDVRASKRKEEKELSASFTRTSSLMRTERHREMTEVAASSELVLCMRKLVEYEAMTENRKAQLEDLLSEGKFDMARTEVLDACMSMLRDGSMVTQRLIETVVHVTSSSAKASHLVENLFSSIDDDGNGVLDLDELESNEETLKNAGVLIPGFGVRMLFNLWETDHEQGRGIDLDSFAAALSYLHIHLGDESAAPEVNARAEMEHHVLMKQRETMRIVYDTIDENGTGSISLADLEHKLGNLEPLGISLPPQSVMSMFDEWDSDHSGSLSFHEFEMAVMRITSYSLQKNTMQDLTDRMRTHKEHDFVVTSEITDHLLDEEPHHFLKRGWLKKLPVLKISERISIAPSARSRVMKWAGVQSATASLPSLRSQRPSPLHANAPVSKEALPLRRGGIQLWSKRFFTLTAHGTLTYFKQVTDAFQQKGGSTNEEATKGRVRRVSTSGGMAHVARPRRKSLVEKVGERVRRLSSIARGDDAAAAVAAAEAVNTSPPPPREGPITRLRRLSSASRERPSQSDGPKAPSGAFEVTHRARIRLGPTDSSEIDVVDGDGNVLTLKAENDADAMEWKKVLDGVVEDALLRQQALQKAALGTYWGALIHKPEWVDDWVALLSSVRTKTRRGLSKEAFTVTKRAAFRGHANQIFGLHWSPDGRYCVSAGVDTKLIVHSLDEEPESTLNGIAYYDPHREVLLDAGWVATCQFSPTLRRIASGGIDKAVSVSSWISKDTIETTAIGTHEGHVHCVRWGAGGDDINILSASKDTTVAMWDAEHSRLVHVFSGHSSDVLALATSAAHPHSFLSASSDCMACFWDTRRCGRGPRAAPPAPLERRALYPHPLSPPLLLLCSSSQRRVRRDVQ